MSGPALDELERAFFAAIAGRGPLAAAARSVRGDARGGAEDRVALYAGMYFHRILDVLRGDFSSVAAVLGADAFEQLIADYLRATPSVSPSIRDVGARLPQFLDAEPRDPPWLADLARLEWARLDVFDAADAAPRTVDELRALPPESFAALPLALIPAHARLEINFAVDEIWRPESAESESAAAEIAPRPGARTLLVWRHDLEVRHRAVDAFESEALALAAARAPFGAVCDRALTVAGEADAAPLAFGLLLRWVSDGLLC